MKTKDKEKQHAEDAPSPPPPEKILYDNRIKRKNVLALNEKVAAIREYEKMPVYKRIGRMFHCSPDQIKRIVQQQDAILEAWEQRTRRSQDAKTLEMKVVRVSMLGKAVYDWIRRMMYYRDITISDGLIQKMALQFKSAMGLQNFFPHQDWCDKFRQTYKITKSDSKLLKIGYTQGYSVQIKDIIKDVLSECTPDATSPPADEHADEDAMTERSEDENGPAVAESRSMPPGKKLTLKPCLSVQPSSELPTRSMPQLQPIRQLVALPFKSNGVGMSQKVLVATPITTAGGAGSRPGNAPMTMTIIPLATIAQSKAQAQAQAQKAATAQAEKQPTVPPPMVKIKEEIKDEPEEVAPIKQEYISDDEDEKMQEEATTSQRDTVAEPVANTTQPKARATEAQLQQTKTKKTALDEYEDLTLSSLRKLMQNQGTSTTAATTTTTTTSISAALTKTTTNSQPESPCTSTPTGHELAREPLQPAVVTIVPSPNTTPPPPMPPLTRAPNFMRTAPKRKHRVDTTPSLPPIKSCAEARKYLKLLEDFALVKENFRLIGLVTRADEVLRELDGNEDVDVD